MAEQTGEPKKRGRKKGSVAAPKSTSGARSKRVPSNLENLTFDQLQQLSKRISELMKTKKDEEIRILKEKLSELEKL